MTDRRELSCSLVCIDEHVLTANIMTSSYFHLMRLVHFFAVFIFAEAGHSATIVEICTHRKFPVLQIYLAGVRLFETRWWCSEYKAVYSHTTEVSKRSEFVSCVQVGVQQLLRIPVNYRHVWSVHICGIW